MTKLNIPTTTGPKIAPDAIGSPRINYFPEKIAECRKCLKRLKMIKLKHSQVLEIYKSKEQISDIVEKYGISRSAVVDIKKGKAHRSITGGVNLYRPTRRSPSPKVKEQYMGYQIIPFADKRVGHYFIEKDGERASQMCLASPKACRQVIDTHTKAISENQKPIYK